MSDTVVGFIRTIIPATVGSLVAILTSWGITVDPGTETALATAAIGIATAVWYAIGRLLEKHLPESVRWLVIPFLGIPKTSGPVYP